MALYQILQGLRSCLGSLKRFTEEKQKLSDGCSRTEVMNNIYHMVTMLMLKNALWPLKRVDK